ncbi:MAG: hypothetical protein R2711_04790 [Acidimicrobiales bacterium]
MRSLSERREEAMSSSCDWTERTIVSRAGPEPGWTWSTTVAATIPEAEGATLASFGAGPLVTWSTRMRATSGRASGASNGPSPAFPAPDTISAASRGGA